MSKIIAKVISKEELYCLIGLLHMAHEYESKQKEIAVAMAGILGVESDDDYYGHISDAVYNEGMSVKDLLRLYKVKVSK